MQCGKNVENKHKKRKRQTSDNDLGKKKHLYVGSREESRISKQHIASFGGNVP